MKKLKSYPTASFKSLGFDISINNKDLLKYESKEEFLTIQFHKNINVVKIGDRYYNPLVLRAIVQQLDQYKW